MQINFQIVTIWNIWSAALSQAKTESDRLVCANVYGLCWSCSSGPGWNALRSVPIQLGSLGGLRPNTGLESAGLDRCAISWFASRPGREIIYLSAVAGLEM